LTLATVVGGYALDRVLAQSVLTAQDQIVMLQLATLTAGAWAYLWLLSRRWVVAWRDRPNAPWAQPLMLVQVTLAAIGNLILLLTALAWLLIMLPLALAEAPQIPLWTLTAGTWLGWAAFAST